jgi:DNA-binding response OmpR family regulator/tRNA A-37 threonylcarbamoyl transferase component Bud32
MPKILVVEDDDQLREILKHALMAESYDVDTAASGEDAVCLLDQRKYDLITLDWNLSDLTGVEVLKRFRAAGGVSPVLLLTANRRLVDKEEGFDAGADDYLSKPFQLKELFMRVKALLRRSAPVHQAAPDPRALKLICVECAGEFSSEDLTVCPNDQSPLLRVRDTLKPGAVFSERYEIAKVLGAGGNSTVYLAKHLLMNKMVALKVLHLRYASDPKTIQRFQREAQSASSLTHENIVSVFDFGVSPDGQPFMVMEYLEGKSLYEMIRDHGPIPWEQAVQLFMQLCRGLSLAHANRVIHRDLKPGNIMLIPNANDSRPYICKLVDFGFAKIDDDSGKHLTHSGEVFGSPLYMSPEQCHGRRIDVRSDVYSLGCIMYCCLAGVPPYDGSSVMDTMAMHLHAPQPMMPAQVNVPNWLQDIVSKAMEKNPSNRFQTIAELGTRLQSGFATMPGNVH